MSKAQVNLYEAKTNLSQLVDRASRGERILIAKSGTPVARLVPLDDGPGTPLRLGLMRGRIRISKGFDEPLPDEVLDAFEGE